jgi:hypothetical protein
VADPAESQGARYVLRYTLTFEDMLGAGRFYQQRTLERVLLLFAGGLLVGVVLLAVRPTIGLAMIVAFAALLLMTKYQITTRLFGPRRVKNLIGRVVQLSLSDAGIDSSGPLSTSQIPWSSVTKVRANGRYMLLLGDSLLLVWVPASAFATPAEMAAVVDYARRRSAEPHPPGPSV